MRRALFLAIVGILALVPFAYAQQSTWSTYTTDQLIQQRADIDRELRMRMDRMTPEERQRLVGRESTLKQPFQSPRRDIDVDTTFENEWQRRVRALPREDQPRYVMPPDMQSPRTDTVPETAR